MDTCIKRLLRLWEQRRNKKRRQKRIANIVTNSNCIGTTAYLFNRNRPRAVARDLMTNKKSPRQRTFK